MLYLNLDCQAFVMPFICHPSSYMGVPGFGAKLRIPGWPSPLLEGCPLHCDTRRAPKLSCRRHLKGRRRPSALSVDAGFRRSPSSTGPPDSPSVSVCGSAFQSVRVLCSSTLQIGGQVACDTQEFCCLQEVSDCNYNCASIASAMAWLKLQGRAWTQTFVLPGL